MPQNCRSANESQKKHPLFWALRKLGGDPALPKLILAFFDVDTSSKVKKVSKLRVGRGGVTWTRGNGLHVHRRGCDDGPSCLDEYPGLSPMIPSQQGMK